MLVSCSTSTAPTPPKKVPGRPWKPGQSGNPSGRPAKDARIIKLADNWTEKSVETLVEIMSDPEARNSDRRESARLLLAYAHGHPRTMREVELNATLSITDAYLEALKEVNERIDRPGNSSKPGDDAKLLEHENAE